MKCPNCGSRDVEVAFSTILIRVFDADENLIRQEEGEEIFEWAECNSCGYRNDGDYRTLFEWK